MIVNSVSKHDQYDLECKWKEVVDRLVGLRDAVRVFQTSAPDVRTPEILGPVLCRVYQMHLHRMSFATLLDDLVYQLNHRTEGLAALTPKHPTQMDSTVPVQEPPKEVTTPPVIEARPPKKRAVLGRLKSPEDSGVITVGPPEVLRELGKAAEQPDDEWTPDAQASIRGPLPPPDDTRNQ